jgi:hypothetical protein
MPEISYGLLAPGRLKERFKTLEEASEAAKDYLKKSTETDKVAIHEYLGTQLGNKGRMVFKIGDIFHYVNTEWLP